MPPPPMVVWLTGWPGSGKSTVGDNLAGRYGFIHVDVDDDEVTLLVLIILMIHIILTL